MEIDETGRDDQPRRVDLPRCRRRREVTDGGDAIAVDRHVGPHSFGTGAVDERAVADDQIVSHRGIVNGVTPRR